MSNVAAPVKKADSPVVKTQTEQAPMEYLTPNQARLQIKPEQLYMEYKSYPNHLDHYNHHSDKHIHAERDEEKVNIYIKFNHFYKQFFKKISFFCFCRLFKFK